MLLMAHNKCYLGTFIVVNSSPIGLNITVEIPVVEGELNNKISQLIVSP
jgi:hypothetical protein